MSIALRTNTAELLKLLSRFDYPAFNKKPGNGGWSAGEIAEHLLLFAIRLNTVFAGNAVPVDRDPQEKQSVVQDRLIDRENKIVAQRRKLNQTIIDMVLSLLLPNSPHRLFGPLTGIEWVQLLIHHCNRHLIQLREILQ